MLKLDLPGRIASAACLSAILVGYACQVFLARPYEGLTLEISLALLPFVGVLSQRNHWVTWFLARPIGAALTVLGLFFSICAPQNSDLPIFHAALCVLLFGLGALVLTPPVPTRPRYILAGAVLLSQVVLQSGAVHTAYADYFDTTLTVRNASTETLHDLSLSGSSFSLSWPTLLPSEVARRSFHITAQQNLAVRFSTAHVTRSVPIAAIFERSDLIALTIKPDLLLDATVIPGASTPARRSTTLLAQEIQRHSPNTSLWTRRQSLALLPSRR